MTSEPAPVAGPVPAGPPAAAAPTATVLPAPAPPVPAGRPGPSGPQPKGGRTGVRGFLGAQIGGLPGPFWALWLGTLVNRAGTFIEPFFVLYLTGPRHVSVQTTGAVLVVWGVGSLLSQPIGGWLTDRFGRRTTLVAGLVTSAATLFALSFARGLLTITAIVFVLGIVADLYRPAAQAAIADLVEAGDRTRAYALQFWAINLGFSVAASSAGIVLHLVGFGLLFVLDAATTLVFGLVCVRFVPETRPEAGADEKPARFADPWKLLITDRLLLGLCLTVLAYAVIYQQVNVLLPLAITRAGLSASVYGYVIALNGVLIVLGQPFVLHWLGAASRRVVLPCSVGLIGVGVAATGLCTQPWQFALTVAVWTTGEVIGSGSFQAVVAALAPAHMRGRYAGALGLAWGMSGLIGPVAGTASFGWSPTLSWLGCLVLAAAGATGMYRLMGEVARREEAPVAGAAEIRR